MTKFIVVAGGVMSGVGKGVTTASIARILREYGYTVTAIKIDPYINYDAGTLRPTEHGEVWVTDDGGEIDQDLGNYERFLNVDIPKKNNITTGQVYKTIIDKERKGKYLGETVQFIPHVPNEIKRRLNEAGKNHDIAIVEIGGTIGDYENIPYLFAMKSMERELGKDNIAYVLITYLPIPSHIEEMKTKPTQQAIRLLGENGIFPDFIICRAKKVLDSVRKKKIETYANIPSTHVISEPDIETVYSIPLDLEKEQFGLKILKELNLKPKKAPNWNKWKKLVTRIEKPKNSVKIAIVGKYIDIGDYNLADSYVSINQSLMHAGSALNVGVNIHWLDAKKFENNNNEINNLKNYKGIIIPGGFGSSGVEGKIKAINFARLNNIPYLGLCYGLQLAVVEYARNVCNMKNANTAEINEKTKFPVIDILPAQKKLMEKSAYGGTMRLGAYAAVLKKNSKVLKLYQETARLREDAEKIRKLKKDKSQAFRLGILDKSKNIVLERHRHRYEVNPKFIDKLEQKGLVFSGYHLRKDHTKLMEFVELPKHSYFIATQSHPEFKSRLGNAAPLFYGFVRACSK
ncbi:CTP synthetase [archaeon]|nr:CTP synthetase [archaeon]MDP6548120.1 CTP synthase (glutamine hydrolyzing) [Candidatus Woesearchaeota archaeon]